MRHTLSPTIPSDVNDHARPHRTVLPWKNSVVRVFFIPACPQTAVGNNETRIDFRFSSDIRPVLTVARRPFPQNQGNETWH